MELIGEFASSLYPAVMLISEVFVVGFMLPGRPIAMMMYVSSSAKYYFSLTDY